MSNTWWMKPEMLETYEQILSRMKDLLVEQRELIGKRRNKQATSADQIRLTQVNAEMELMHRSKRSLDDLNPLLVVTANLTGTRKDECLPGVEKGDSPALLSFLQLLVLAGRIEDVIPSIDTFIRHCEINGGWKREYIAAQLPGIFCNKYFTQLGRDFSFWFSRWSHENPGWGNGLKSATTGAELRAAVNAIVAQVHEYADKNA